MTKQIWFYDNDHKNAPNSDNESIKFIKIPEIGSNKELADMSWDHYKNWDNNENEDYPHYNGISNYFFNKVSKVAKFNDIMKMELYDSYSGIQEPHVTELNQNVNEELVSAIVFDWDRTLTKIEGIYEPIPKYFDSIINYLKHLEEHADNPSKRFPGITSLGEKGFIDYLFHNNTDETPEEIGKRSKLIGKMIKDLQDKNIPTFILTNNKTALKPEGKKLFKLIIDGLLEPGKINFPIDHILFNKYNTKQTIELVPPEYRCGKEAMIMQDIMQLIPEEMKPGTRPTLELEPEPIPSSNRSLGLEGGSKKVKRKSKKLSKNNKKSKKVYKNSKKSKRLSKINKKSKILYKNSKKSKRLSKSNKKKTKKL